MIIDIAISAEALFTKEHKNITSNLKGRLSNFIAAKRLERTEIEKNVGDFCYLRGAIVHGGKRKITRDDFKNALIMRNYVKKAIDKALDLKLYQKKDLLQFIEKNTLS